VRVGHHAPNVTPGVAKQPLLHQKERTAYISHPQHPAPHLSLCCHCTKCPSVFKCAALWQQYLALPPMNMPQRSPAASTARHALSASSILLLIGAQGAPVASNSLAVDVAVGNTLRNILVALGPFFCQPPLCGILFSLLRLTRTSLPAGAAACHMSIPSYARSPSSIHNRPSWRCPVPCHHSLRALPCPPLICIVLCSLLRHTRK
jgi:hypothetical protein